MAHQYGRSLVSVNESVARGQLLVAPKSLARPPQSWYHNDARVEKRMNYDESQLRGVNPGQN